MAEFFSNFFSSRLGFSDSWLWLADVLAALIHAALIINVIAVGALLFIWMERKISGRIQDRLGPTRVGGKFGWLQTLADGLKLITKEDLIPAGADAMLFRMAPYIAFCASFGAFLALPFADGWVAIHMNTAVFFVLAVLGLEVFGVILAGYASASKWSLFGAMREAAQVVSYEVPLGLCVIVPVILAGSMDLTVIGEKQAGWFTNWYVFHDPGTFGIAFVYFTCAMASVNRAPFDLAEAESELVAGFHTEYSGLRWSYFFMAEYGSMFLVSGLAAILVLRWMERTDSGYGVSGAWLCGRSRRLDVAGLPWQLPRHAQLHYQVRHRRDRDDVGTLDAASLAYRPSHDDVLEVLFACGRGLFPRRMLLAVLASAQPERHSPTG